MVRSSRRNLNTCPGRKAYALAQERCQESLAICHEVLAHPSPLDCLGLAARGLGKGLGLGILTEAGALILQPKMLKGIKARAEAAGGQQRGSPVARTRDELWQKLIRTASPAGYTGSVSLHLLTMCVSSG